MTSLKLAVIPYDHILAEVAAYPIATEASLQLAPTMLDAKLGENTGSLWRMAENYLLSRFPGFSIDEIVAIRDDIWFSRTSNLEHNNSLQIHLHSYLKQLANRCLEVCGSVAIPKVIGDKVYASGFDGKGSLLARRTWRWLSLALPADLILAALGNAQQGPETINLLSPDLDRILRDSGYAETHLHLGAALNFSTIWVGLLYQLATPQLKEHSFKSPGAKFDDGKLFAPWLVRIALIRYALAAFLAYKQPNESFITYLFTRIREGIIRDGGLTSFAMFLQAISDLQMGRLSNEPLPQWTGLYALITRLSSRHFPTDLQQIYEIDPIASLIPYRTQGRATPEMTFIALSLEYLSNPNQNNSIDSLFAKLFWQVQRIRVLFYQHITQRPMVAGLQWFIRFFGRMKEARKPFTPKILLQSAAHLCGLQKGLRSLEVRLGFPASTSEAFQQIQDLSNCANEINRTNQGLANPPLEVGVVYHFNKNRGGGSSEGKPKAYWINSEADPSTLLGQPSANPTGFRYANYYMQKRLETISLVWLLCNFPKSVEFIRGIDLCADELGVPNWVFLPLVKGIRQAASLAMAELSRYSTDPLPAFRTTIHTGEDFVHLLTGLRNVDQTIEQFSLREGDRIGHGIALGVNAELWATRSGRVAMAREERLFDLVWEWSWYSCGKGISSKGRQHALEYEIATLSRQIFGENITPYSLNLLHSNLYLQENLYKLGFPEGNHRLDIQQNITSLENNSLLLLYRYLSDPGIFYRGREIVWVDPSTEAETLVELQKTLRHKLSSRGITIEVNPTSNLLIGDMGDMASHPLWRLYPPRQDANLPPVSICIGSDDPIIFASNLREEYQWLSDALKFAGLSNEEVYTWLNRVRERGLESRFTLPFREFSIDSIRQLREPKQLLLL